MSDAARIADTASEREFIGGLLARPDAVEAYLEHASCPGLFTDPLCEDAWLAITSLGYDGAAVSIPAVRSHLISTSHRFPDQGAVMGWLMQAHSDAPSSLGEISAAFDRVRRCYRTRQIEEVAATYQNRARLPGADPDELLTELSQQVAEIEAQSSGSRELESGDAVVGSTIEEIFLRRDRGEMPGIPTGSRDLDEILGKLAPTHFVILAARPAGGKSVGGLDMVRSALEHGAGVLFASYEMPKTEVMIRMLAAQGSIDTRNLSRGQVTPRDEERLALAATSLPWENLTMLDDPNVSAAQLIAQFAVQIRRWKAKGITDYLLVIDYVQIMRHHVPGKRDASRQQEIAETCRVLKNGANTLGAAIVALCQVGRAADEGVPKLKDLRESGDLENYADQVIFLHRPSAHNPEDRPGEIDYITAKNRHGRTGTVARAEQFHLSRVVDLASLA